MQYLCQNLNTRCCCCCGAFFSLSLSLSFDTLTTIITLDHIRLYTKKSFNITSVIQADLASFE